MRRTRCTFLRGLAIAERLRATCNDEKRAFIRRIENLECEQIFYLDCYRYISKIEIFEHLEEFKLTTSSFETGKEINHIITCKFKQLQEIEKLIKKEVLQ